MRRRLISGMACMVLAVAASSAWAASSAGEAVTLAADRLVGLQAEDGTWPDEADYTGPIVAGLVNAFQLTGSNAYRAAAFKGADYILGVPGGNLLGDEAYALTLAADITPSPSTSAYRTAVSTFYDTIVRTAVGGTSTYINDLVDYYSINFDDQSQSAFYLAQHTAAAYRVDAIDKAVWRSSLVNTLAQVDDNDLYPIFALGAATWALARTGPLDSTPVDPSASAGSVWEGVALKDLPSLLLAQQVAGGPEAGAFYADFAHSDGGYTEDTVYGTLGLMASAAAGVAGLGNAVAAGQASLIAGVDTDGMVFEHVSQTGGSLNLYAGETLQAIPEPGTLTIAAAGAILLLGGRRKQS